MKNIYKKISFLFILSSVIFFSSCAVNDDDPVVAVTKNTITAQTEKTFERIESSVTSYTAVINFSQAVTNFSRVYYTVNGTPLEADVDEGSTSLEVMLDFSDPSVLFQSVEITDFKIIDANTDNVEPVVSATLKELNVVKGTDKFLFILTWEGDSDLDCATIQRTPTGVTAIDLSDGTTNTEVVRLPEAIADGDYAFAVLPWTVSSNAIKCYLTVINGSQVEKFTGTLRDATPGGFFGYTTIADFVTIEKTTDAGSGEAMMSLTQVLFE
ncbi:conserved exported protein of unknown function [Tenacibaculum sp. 190130A14a]|uniref:SEA domain-containing protein n=1 Tax=Tenacibaculum polynesiense TaxID=3137857 RepID=A0ABP1EXV0_9FLAO